MTRSDPHVSSGFRLPAAYKASFSADDAKLVMLCSDVVVWDVAKRLKRYRVHPLTHPSHCDVEPRGKHVAIKSTAGIVLTLDIRDGAVAQVIDDGTQGEGTNILYSPCSNFIVDGTWSGGLTVREVASGKVAFERRREGETIHRICARVARKRWVVHHGIKYPSERPDYVTAWTWPFRRPKCFEIGHDVISALAISPDGKHFVTCGPCRKKASRVTVRSTADGGVVVEAKIDQCELVTQIAWSPAGGVLAVVAHKGVHLVRYPDFAPQQRLDLMKKAYHLVFDTRGTQFVVSGYKQSILLARKL